MKHLNLYQSLKGVATTGRRGVVLCALIWLAGGGNAVAVPITYTFSGTGSGSLGGQSFVNSAFTFTSTADTSRVSTGSVFGNIFVRVVNSSASVFVAGLGTADFVGVSLTTINQTGGSASLSAPLTTGSPYALLQTDNSVFHTYDLKTSLGPISTTLIAFDRGNYATSLGNFSLTAVSSAVVFQAAIQAVPDATSTLELLGISAAILMGCFWRQHGILSRKAAAVGIRN